MSVLNHLAQAAAVLLLIDVLVIAIIFMALAGGLAFGLRWARGKLKPTLEKVAGWERKGAHYIGIGTQYAARPVIILAGFAERTRATADGIRTRVRRLQRSPTRTL